MSTTAHVLAARLFASKSPGQQPSRQVERRRPSQTQGRALEVLGHAIEYLADSRLDEMWDTSADAEAVHMLMACSRAVFTECEVILSWQQRLQRTALRRLHPSR